MNGRTAREAPYRTLDDVQRILATLRGLAATEPRVAVIGGGLLGIEAARTLQQRGCRVVVVESSSQLLPRQLDPLAARVEDSLTAAGIELCLRARIQLGNPLAPGLGRDVTWQRPGAYRRLVVDKGRLMAAIAVGPWDDLPFLQQLLSQGKRLERSRLTPAFAWVTT